MSGAHAGGVVVLLISLLGLSACSSPPAESPSLEEEVADRDRREREADRLYREGVEAARDDRLDEAEQRFAKAVAADPLHGRAHNDLGAIYFKRGRLYKAAEHFDAASRQLMDRPEPMFNLGLVFERADQWHQAVEAYQRALDISPGSPRIMENLARAYIELDIHREETVELLRQARLRDNRPDWRRWIDLQLARLDRQSNDEADAPADAEGAEPRDPP